MTSKERKKWIKKIKPYWELRNKDYDEFRRLEDVTEKQMSKELGEDLEFFYVEGECVGIGHTDWARRKKGKNHFPLIHDRELE